MNIGETHCGQIFLKLKLLVTMWFKDKNLLDKSKFLIYIETVKMIQ